METINKKWDAEASKELKKKFKEVKTFSDLDKLRDEYLLGDRIYPNSAQEFFEEFKNENDIWKHDPSFWEDRGIHYYNIDYFFFVKLKIQRFIKNLLRIVFSTFFIILFVSINAPFLKYENK